MDRNTVFAILLIFLIWTFWPGLQKKQAPSPAPVATNLQSASENEKFSMAPMNSAAVAAPKTSSWTPNQPVTEKVLENSLLSVTLSSRQGAPVSIQLKKFFRSLRKEREISFLQPDQERSDFLALAFSDVAPKDLNAARVINVARGYREVEADAGHVVYEALLPNGILVRRTFSLEPDSYNLRERTEMRNQTSAPVTIQPGILWRLDGEGLVNEARGKGMLSGGRGDDVLHAVSLAEGKKRRSDHMKPEKNYDVSGEFQWTGLSSRYFLAAVLPSERTLLTFEPQAVSGADGVLSSAARLFGAQAALAPGETRIQANQIFVGPKDVKILKSQGRNLQRALDLGMFEIFALFLLRLLQGFQHFLGNWGLSIVALTLLVKIVFFPFSQMSFRSMREMQRIQPLLAEMRERYKDDKQQLNMQTLKIMKEHKVNPLGGCLPMLIQMPIYFALYQVLYNSIELRQAPFYFWIKDLSVADPLFISPVLMGLAMFAQQKISPKPADPMQAQVMTIMPIMFAAMMIFLPSGLVIYIFCNTALTVAQQWYVNRGLKQIEPGALLAT